MQGSFFFSCFFFLSSLPCQEALPWARPMLIGQLRRHRQAVPPKLHAKQSDISIASLQVETADYSMVERPPQPPPHPHIAGRLGQAQSLTCSMCKGTKLGLPLSHVSSRKAEHGLRDRVGSPAPTPPAKQTRQRQQRSTSSSGPQSAHVIGRGHGPPCKTVALSVLALSCGPIILRCDGRLGSNSACYRSGSPASLHLPSFCHTECGSSASHSSVLCSLPVVQQPG